MHLIVLLLAVAFPPATPQRPAVPGLELSEPNSYHVRMTTTFAVPAGDKGIELLRVYQALPAVRPWTETGTILGASNISHQPAFGKRIREEPDADSIFWELKAPKSASRHVFVTDFVVVSYTREFRPAAVQVDWGGYAQPQDKSAVVNPDDDAKVHPELAKTAAAIRATNPPPAAVLEICKWIQANLTYDASVSYGPDDIDAILKNKRGHCGHQFALFDQLATGAGIPVRSIGGLNLYVPDGRTGELQKIRADWTNIHTWSEVYFPGVGWIEIDPGFAEAPFRLGHHLIQNNRRFQNYVVWMREAGVEKFATWTYRDGAYVSDYGVENIISYAEKPVKKQ
jgi:Transglutaminase-like superfamily